LLFSELVKKSQIHTVGRRTSRIPVTVPADRNATDDDMAKFKSVNNSTKNNAEEINNVCNNFLMDEFSPNGSSGITEANKADQGQIFLDSKGSGDAEIYQSQHLKKRKFQQTKDEEVGTGKVEHETVVAAKEGIKLADSLDQQQILSDFISEGIYHKILIFHCDWLMSISSIFCNIFLVIYIIYPSDVLRQIFFERILRQILKGRFPGHL
jgi:hypothetical protein